MTNKKKSIQQLGGRARADKLPPEDRSDIAKRAAEARWATAPSLIPKETHTGVLKIGHTEIPCSVLDNNGRALRVFSTRGFTRAMGGSRTGTMGPGAPQIPPFLASDNIKSFISERLMARLISPIIYKPKHGGRTAFGFEATLLPDVCEVIIAAERTKKLKPNQKHLAEMAHLLLVAFAKVGITALVDEATGYQYDRAREELTRILEAYISPELMPWTRKFPDEFFKQVYRLHNWEYKPENAKKGPRYVGKLIKKYVYEELPPGVLDELHRINPPNEKGQRRHKHFQYLTADTGNPHLDKQITVVTTLMRIAGNKAEFQRLFGRAFPKAQIELPDVLGIDTLEANTE